MSILFKFIEEAILCLFAQGRTYLMLWIPPEDPEHIAFSDSPDPLLSSPFLKVEGRRVDPSLLSPALPIASEHLGRVGHTRHCDCPSLLSQYLGTSSFRSGRACTGCARQR